MKRFVQFGLPALLVASSAMSAGAPSDGWYFGLFLVGSYIPSADFTLSASEFAALNTSIAIYNSANFPPMPFPSSPNGEIEYQFGGGVGGQYGYRWCGFRFEGELLFNYNSFKEVTIGGIEFENERIVTTFVTPTTSITTVTNPYSISGHAQFIGVLANVFYDFYDHGCKEVTWYPYIGAGIGYAQIQNNWVVNSNQVSVLTSNLFYTPILHISDSEFTPIAQAIIGVGYQLDDYFSVFADYRYLTSKQLETLDDRLNIHTINLGFNYWFC